jgi:hypothetical protein
MLNPLGVHVKQTYQVGKGLTEERCRLRNLQNNWFGRNGTIGTTYIGGTGPFTSKGVGEKRIYPLDSLP